MTLRRVSTEPLVEHLKAHEDDIASERDGWAELRMTFFDMIGRWPKTKEGKVRGSKASA